MDQLTLVGVLLAITLACLVKKQLSSQPFRLDLKPVNLWLGFIMAVAANCGRGFMTMLVTMYTLYLVLSLLQKLLVGSLTQSIA